MFNIPVIITSQTIEVCQLNILYIFISFKNKLETLSEELKKKSEFAEELQSMVCVFLN